jgi:Phage P22-like portal protein
MADAVDRAPNDGAVGMPSIDGAMNKLPPANATGGKGSKDDQKNTRLGMSRSKERAVLDRARKRMDKATKSESENRKAALDDLKFYRGEQWPSDVQAQRNFDQRPCLTINKLPTFVNQATNDVRQNRPAINVSPVGDKGDPEVAKMFAGMIREIERKSVADIAYDTAFATTARCGFGYWRVITEFEKPNSFNQVITVKRIRNPFTVYLDPAHEEPDGSDAKWAFISDMLPRSEFTDEYPDAQPMPWTEGGIGDSQKSWIGKDEVRIAEYFEVVTEKRTLVRLSNGATGWRDDMDPRVLARFAVEEEREADCNKIKWYKITAVEVLEERDWPGSWIPVVKVIGDEVDIEGKVHYNGIVRNAKDAQRMYNYWVTLLTELIALQPKAPFIGAEGQFEGHEQEWKTANVKSTPYLEYKVETVDQKPLPPPQRQPMTQPATGVMAAMQGSAQDMMATTGIRFDATTKDLMYDESGRALRELRKFGDLGWFHLVDNLSRSLRHTGVIIVELIPKIYNSRRIETILREDGGEERVTIDPAAEKPMQETRDPQSQKVMKIFNPTYGEYGVTVTIGPSFATKRIEAAESMMDFVRAIAPAAPQAATGIMDLIAKNQDWPGSEEFATRLSKLVAQLHPGITAPDIKDVPPQVQAVLMGMQSQLQQSQQQIVQLTKALTDQQADRAQRDRKIELDFEAKVLSTMQKADQSANAHLLSRIELVHTMLESMLKPHDAQVQ